MILNTDDDRKKIKAYLKEAAQARRRVQEEQASLRDIFKVLQEEYDIKPTLARKVLAIMDKGNMPEVQETHENIADLYAIVVG